MAKWGVSDGPDRVQAASKDPELRFHLPAPHALRAGASLPLVALDGCGFSYPVAGAGAGAGAGAAQPAGPLLLRGLTLQVVAGARVAIVGENGAGKSTLVGLISGALTPTAGSVHIAPGAGIGVVSQHQLERLQRHLDQTPLDVLRFEAGEAQPPPRDQVSRS